MKMWSGRFRQPLDADFERWQRSFDFDRRLLREELAASHAHATALKNAGILSSSELIAILEGLKQIGEKAAASPAFLDDSEAEDVHHFVEKQLVALIGDTGYKLHSGRSRNEQIATDLRLYVRAAIDQIRADLAEWLSISLDRAEQAGTAAMPAYTHLQRAEPVLVAHWLLAYVEMFLRDADRLADCRKRLNLSPVGFGRRGRRDTAARPPRHGRRAGLRRSNRQQHRRHQRSRFCAGVCWSAFSSGRAPEPMGGRDDFVFVTRVWVHRFA